MAKLALTENALTVLNRRYLQKDDTGAVVETPEEMFQRVATFIAGADRLYGANDDEVGTLAEAYYEIMTNLEFIPNSPTLMNAGRPLGQLSACFVIPVGDSLEEIMEAVKQSALIHKSGGGTGFSFSRLRPANSLVASTFGIASGPVSFMGIFDATTEAVKQGGTRRGANMAVLRVDHPDIIEFINCKQNTSKLTNFNISVAVTTAFMNAVELGISYNLVDPLTGQPYLRDGKTIQLDAGEVFDRLVDSAYRTGEPGVIFLDRMNEHNPTNEVIEATNPCGEQPLPPNDSCNLGSINVGRFVVDGLIDFKRLGTVVKRSVHFLDNVIDRNEYPFQWIKDQTLKNRRIGLGIMGWADLLVKVGLRYGSKNSIKLANKLMKFINTTAHEYSQHLAMDRGSFPNWPDSIYAGEGTNQRNATLTTIAPTGTISIIAGCSSGIEPFYALAYQRNIMGGTKMSEVNPLFKAHMKQLSPSQQADLMVKLPTLLSVEGVVPDDMWKLFHTAADVTPDEHVAMQAAFQKHVDSSVSKTINFPHEATREDIAHSFKLAYQTGCKGITVYRDHCRPDQPMSVGK